jgi:hypothetical protein
MDKRIQNIEHDVDGWWVYLKPGWVQQPEGTHAIVEDRKRDALDKMSLVVPCDCAECRQTILERASMAMERQPINQSGVR